MQSNEKGGTVPKLSYRKTSAEIVSEAKNSLMASGIKNRLINDGSVKLFSTKRPITPNVTKRQLYGMDGPAGRPPSAFNLKYLQYETRALPCLEPIAQAEEKEVLKKFERSGSLGTIPEAAAKTKLPALKFEPSRMKTAGSMENCKSA